MKSYHLTQEKSDALAEEFFDLDLIPMEIRPNLKAFANAVLDQVLGEPVGVTGEMPGTSGSFTMAAFRSDDVPNNTKLYAPKEQP